jgi:hypothetical protein
MSQGTAFTQYITELGSKNPQIPASLLVSVANACKLIAKQVEQGALAGIIGSAGSGNVQGEIQQKLDIISNDILLEACGLDSTLAGMASEEMETIFPMWFMAHKPLWSSPLVRVFTCSPLTMKPMSFYSSKKIFRFHLMPKSSRSICQTCVTGMHQ